MSKEFWAELGVLDGIRISGELGPVWSYDDVEIWQCRLGVSMELRAGRLSTCSRIFSVSFLISFLMTPFVYLFSPSVAIGYAQGA